MTRSVLSPELKGKYADRLLRQLEECSLDGISCELCSNAIRCRELYDMLPIFINDDNYQRYSRGFASFRMTKETRDNNVFCSYLFQENKGESS